jgi:hypothetical protein
MARLNTGRLVEQATEFAGRTSFVCQDPAVAKAARTARVDVTQAAKSTAVLIREGRSAWRRSAPVVA